MNLRTRQILRIVALLVGMAGAVVIQLFNRQIGGIGMAMILGATMAIVAICAKRPRPARDISGTNVRPDESEDGGRSLSSPHIGRWQIGYSLCGGILIFLSSNWLHATGQQLLSVLLILAVGGIVIFMTADAKAR